MRIEQDNYGEYNNTGKRNEHSLMLLEIGHLEELDLPDGKLDHECGYNHGKDEDYQHDECVTSNDGASPGTVCSPVVNSAGTIFEFKVSESTLYIAAKTLQHHEIVALPLQEDLPLDNVVTVLGIVIGLFKKFPMPFTNG